MSVTISLIDNPSLPSTSTMTLISSDPCDQQIEVDSIPDQVVYVNGPQVSFQVTSTGPLNECTLTRVYAFTDASFNSWMSID